MASSSFLKLDGQNYIVSREFATAVRRELGTLTFDTKVVDTERLALMHASNVRNLTLGEQRKVDYLTHVKNVADTIRVVGDHHDPVKEWNFDGWDAVHGNAPPAEACGCQKHYVFDYHSAVNHFGHNRVSPDRAHHEIEPRRVCDLHE